MKNGHTKGLAAVLLAGAMSLGALVSCGQSAEKATDQSAKNNSPASSKAADQVKPVEKPTGESFQELSPKNFKKVTIGCAIHSTDNEYWNQEALGVKLFAASLPKDTAEVQVLTCDGNDEKQLNGIKSFAASHGEDCILYVDPSNAPNTAAIAQFCEQNHIYWTSVWHLAKGLNPADFKYYVVHQSVDGVAQGYDCALDLFKNFKTPDKGKILALQGQLGNDSAIERYEGLQKALKEHTDVELLDTQVADWNPQKALTITETWLAKYGDKIDGIWCANDDMALGALQALKAKHLNGKVKLCGTDGVSAALKAIKDGDMVCTVANNGYLQGGYGAAYAYAAYNGEVDFTKINPARRVFYTKGTFIDKSNLEKFEEEYVNKQPKYDFNNLNFPINRLMDISHNK